MFELIKKNRGLNITEGLFDNFLNDNLFHINPSNNMDCYLSSDDKKYYLEIALPGLDKKDISLNFNTGFLYLSYENKKDVNDSYWNRSFSRRMKLPNNIKSDSIKADLKNGILTINIDKNKIENQNQKIEIK